MRETAVIPLPAPLPAEESSKRVHCPPSYQKASWTEPLEPIHHTSMLFGMRETAVIPPFVAALPPGASSNRCHCAPSYQKASCTSPLGPIHHTSIPVSYTHLTLPTSDLV